MRAVARWSALGFLLLYGCSHPMFMIEQQAVNSHLLVVELSDEGLIERETARIKMPHVVKGKSDAVVRNNRIYICTYKQLYILERSMDGVLELVSSLPIAGYDVALALHPQKPVVYVVDEKSITVVNVEDAANPELAQYLLLADELKKIPQDVPIMGPAGTDIACENGKLAVTVEFLDLTLGISGAVMIFDVASPLTPRIERILDGLPGALAVALGLCDHQILVVGEKVSQYRNFIEEKHKHVYPDTSWLRKPVEDSGWLPNPTVPGRVVEVQLVLGPVGDSPERIQWSANQYRSVDASERQRLRSLGGLDHGILYVATEHVLAHYNTINKHIIWKYTNDNVSDYFDHLYGLAMRGHEQAYLAAGRSGVYVLNKRRQIWFITHACYNDVPGPVLDVYVENNKLYILCGE